MGARGRGDSALSFCPSFWLQADHRRDKNDELAQTPKKWKRGRTGLLGGFSRPAICSPLDPAWRRGKSESRTGPENPARDSVVPEAFPRELRWGHDRPGFVSRLKVSRGTSSYQRPSP